MQAPHDKKLEQPVRGQETNPRRKNQEAETKERHQRMKLRILELILANSDGTKPILVIPHGGGPHLVRR